MQTNHQKCLFVTNSGYLSDGGGGVQWCTCEYLRILREGGFDCKVRPYRVDMRPSARLRRRLSRQPFENFHPPNFVQSIVNEARALEASLLFLNNTEALALAPKIREKAPQLTLVFLSHGVEITDEINQLRLSPDQLPSHRRNPLWFGRLLCQEIEVRKAIDGTICISEEDRLFESWLGSPRSCFVPRTVPEDTLTLRPIGGRIGTVSTLNHIPNLDGITRLAAELDPKRVKLRLVGGPETAGRELDARFTAVEYLGRLDDVALREEAATWCAFANPVFCQARGASTKVATALGWGLPVLTTAQGARGYRWNEAILPLADSPQHLAQIALEFADSGKTASGFASASALAGMAPTPSQAADLTSEFLCELRSL